MKKQILILLLAVLAAALLTQCSRGSEQQSASVESQKQEQAPASPAASEPPAQVSSRAAELDRRESELKRRESDVARRGQASRRTTRPASTSTDRSGDAASRDRDERDVYRSDSRDRSAGTPALTRALVVPAGTEIRIRMADPLDTRTSQPGDRFRAILDRDLVADRQVVARAGSDVEGQVVDVVEAGKVQGRSELSFTLTSLSAGGRTYRIDTDTKHMRAESSVKEDAAIIGGTTGAGAAIGAVTKGKKGAAVGAAIGAAAGTAAVLTQRGKYIEVRPETEFSFRLRDELMVRR